MFTIQFLGTRGLVPQSSELHKQFSAMIIEWKKQAVLFNFGLTWKDAPLPEVDAIYLSHGHIDDIGGLQDRTVDIPIYCSEATKELLPKSLKASDIRIVPRDGKIELLDWEVECFPVKHATYAPVTGLALYIDNKKVVVPFDVLEIPELDILFDTDVFIADGDQLEQDTRRRDEDSGEMHGHGSLQKQLRWCNSFKIPVMLIHHFGKDAIKMSPEDLLDWLNESSKRIAPRTLAIPTWDGKTVQVEGNNVLWERMNGEVVKQKMPKPVDPEKPGEFFIPHPQRLSKNLLEEARAVSTQLLSSGRDNMVLYEPKLRYLPYIYTKAGKNIAALSDGMFKQIKPMVLSYPDCLTNTEEVNRLAKEFDFATEDFPLILAFLKRCKVVKASSFLRNFNAERLSDYIVLSTSEELKWPSSMEHIQLAKMEVSEEVLMKRPLPIGGGRGFMLDVLSQFEDFSKYDKYVEPFAGGATLFFHNIEKLKGKTVVLNDTDPLVVAWLRFLRDGTDEQLEKLRGFDWRPKKETFKRLKNTAATTMLEKVYKLIYTTIYSWQGLRDSFSADREERIHNLLSDKKINRFREAMKAINPTITQEDGLDVMKEYDSPRTFFYLDPPTKLNFSKAFKTEEFQNAENLEKFFNLLAHVEGDFFWTTNPTDRYKKLLTRKFLANGRHLYTLTRKGKDSYPEIIVSSMELPFKDTRRWKVGTALKDVRWRADLNALMYNNHKYREDIFLNIPKVELRSGLAELSTDDTWLFGVSNIPIEKIDPDWLHSLDVTELMMIHARLHALYYQWKKEGKTIEPLVNAHQFVANEIRGRGLEHRISTDIDRLSKNQKNASDFDIEKEMQDFLTMRPYAYIVGSIVVNGFGRDVDILTRDTRYNETFSDNVQTYLKHMGVPVHIFPDPIGPFTSYKPLVSMGYFREVNKKAVPEELSQYWYEDEDRFCYLSDVVEKLPEFYESKPCVFYSVDKDTYVLHLLSDENTDIKALKFRLSWQLNEVKHRFEEVTEAPEGAKPLFTRGWVPEDAGEIITMSDAEKKDIQKAEKDETEDVSNGKVSAIVVNSQETKTDGVYLYDCALEFGEFKPTPSALVTVEGRNYANVGRFASVIKLNKGDIIELSYRTLDFVRFPNDFSKITLRKLQFENKSDVIDTFASALKKAESFDTLSKQKLKAGENNLETFTQQDLVKSIEKYDPSEVADDVLSDDWKIVNAWFSTVRQGKQFKYDASTVLSVGKKIFRELVRREKVTFRPENLSRNSLEFLQRILSEEIDRGMVLPDSQAERIMKGEKKAVVKSRPFDVPTFILLTGSDGKVYGWLRFGFTRLNTPKQLQGKVKEGETFAKITKEEFEALRDIHNITDDEKEKWWPGSNDLYIYPIREFVKIETKNLIHLPKDNEGFIKGVFIEDQVGSKIENFLPEERTAVELQESKLVIPQTVRNEINKWRNITRKEVAKRSPSSFPEYFFVIENHFRGKSSHLDLRIMQPGKEYLNGFTVLSEVPDTIKKPVLTLKEAAKFSDLDNRKLWKFHPDMDPNKHVRVEMKEKQPPEWLKMVRKVIPPGGPGATKEFPGVFWGVDWGILYPGVTDKGRFNLHKPWFQEFFLYGKKFKGRLVLRYISGDSPHWEAWMAKDQTPYLMTSGARKKKDYIPPKDVSGLSPDFEALIPTELKWWGPDAPDNKDEIFKRMEQARLLLRDKGVLKEAENKDNVVGLAKDAEFTVHYLWSKGPDVVRKLRQEDFIIRVREGNEVTTWNLGKDSPFWIKRGQAYNVQNEVTKNSPPDKHSPVDWMDWEGELPPSHPLNPNKELPLNVEVLDAGDVDIISETSESLHYRFNGKKLKGDFIFVREDANTPNWRFQKGKLPKKAESTVSSF